tara:strand:- start:1682 stop:2143 length:462 start_codon:yes stop_codon:yes gene_type:complete
MVANIGKIEGEDRKWVKKGANPDPGTKDTEGGFWKQQTLLDKFINKFISRKFLLLIITLGLLVFTDKVTESTFQIVAMMYLAVQGIQDAAHQVALVLSAWKGGTISNIRPPTPSITERIITKVADPAVLAPTPITPSEHESESEEEEPPEGTA